MENFKKILIALLLFISLGVKGQQSMFFGLNKQGFTAWDLSTAQYNDSKNISAKATRTTSIRIGNSDMKLYVIDANVDSVFQYNFGTKGDLSTLTYSGKSVYIGGLLTQATGIDFNPSGTLMFIAGYGTNFLYKYTLSTAWDISTATATVGNEYSWSSTQGIRLSPNGYMIFQVDADSKRLNEWVLPNPWDITSKTNPYYLSFTDTPQDVDINSDGSKFYVGFYKLGDMSIREYTASSVYNPSTATLTHTKSISYTPTGLTWSSDGKELYVIDYYSTIYHYKNN